MAGNRDVEQVETPGINRVREIMEERGLLPQKGAKLPETELGRAWRAIQDNKSNITTSSVRAVSGTWLWDWELMVRLANLRQTWNGIVSWR